MKTKHYLLSLLIVIGNHTYGQIITTIAGNGTAGYTGIGTAATAAELNRPKATAIDDSGYVYIADADNNVIRKIDLAGNITTIAGYLAGGFGGDHGPATSAALSRPNSIALDHKGNIFICDADNQRIRKIDTAGIITTIAGDGTAGYNGDGRADTCELNYPGAIAIDKNDNIYITDEYNNMIRKIDTAGMMTTVAGNGLTGYSGAGGPATAASIPFPFGIAVDTSGNIYFSLTLNNVICKVDNTGTLTTLGGTDGLNGASGDDGPAVDALFDTPWGMACDIAGNVYIADNANQRIRMINTAGTVTRIAGTSTGFAGDNGPALAAKLRDPAGVSLDATGNVYIADYNNHRIRKVSIVDHTPYFTAGASHTITACSDSVTLVNSSLSVIDSDNAQLETWSLVATPMHGSLVSSYGVFSSWGATLTPAGLSYTPTAGYSGNDSFKVQVSDGIAADTITIYATVAPCGTTAVNNTQLTAESIQLYPNPNNGVFTCNLSSPMKEKASVVITNIVGERVKEYSITTNEAVDITLSSPAGIYFLMATTTHGKLNQKIVLTK